MKGVIFTEFIDLVEQLYGLETVDAILIDADLPNGGAFTRVGTYDHTHIVTLVTLLSDRVGTPVPDLLKAYGEHLFARLASGHPAITAFADDLFGFLKGIDGIIHVEVRKLYPKAELPSIQCADIDPQTLSLRYRSDRGLADVAEGLILGCARSFETEVTVERRDESDGAGRDVLFTITRQERAA